MIVYIACLSPGCKNAVSSANNEKDIIPEHPATPAALWTIVIESKQLIASQSWSSDMSYPICTLYASGGIATIDTTRTYIADEKGRFIIDSLSDGAHKLTLRHKYFEPLDTVIVVDTAAFISMPMAAKKVDFFPIFVGRRWVYDYYYRRTTPSPITDTIFNGTLIWEIISDSGNGNYGTREIRYGVGSYTHSIYPERNNTGVVPADTAINVFHINTGGEVYYRSSFFGGYYSDIRTLRWFYPVEDSVYKRYDYGGSSVRMGIGIIYVWAGYAGNTKVWHTLNLKMTE